MQRITISLDDETAAALDHHVAAKGYANRSEAVRDLVRDAVSRRVAGDDETPCLGILSYLFDHERRELARKLTHTHHDHRLINLSTLHLHLDHHTCLEVAVLRGTAGEIRELTNRISTERGVRLGEVRLVGEDNAWGRDADPDTPPVSPIGLTGSSRT